MLERAQKSTTKMTGEIEQLFCVEKLNRLELEGRSLRGDNRNIYKILKSADKVGKALFFPKHRIYKKLLQMSALRCRDPS